MWGGTAQDLSRCGGFVEGGGHISPRPACGERSDRIADAIRVRGSDRNLFCLIWGETPPRHALRARGEGRRRRLRRNPRVPNSFPPVAMCGDPAASTRSTSRR